MKLWQKRALALGCALTLAAGSAAASSVLTTRTLEAQYMGIKLQVNGQTVTPVDGGGAPTEPFAADGTIYVPVRTLGQILGKAVIWDPETRTVAVGEAPFVEDAKELVSYIESAHPAFPLGLVPEEYEAAKAALMSAAEDPNATLYQFSAAALAYTASLEDGHTAVSVFGNGPQKILEGMWTADGDKLYRNGAQVTGVGGLTVEQLFTGVDKYFPAENASARNLNHTSWGLTPNVLNLIGATLSEDGSCAAVTAGGKQENVAFVLPEGAETAGAIAAGEQMGDVYYVDLNQCILGEEVDAVSAELAAAVKNGTHKVIIDVRGNGGGNSAACAQLLAAVGMAPPSYGEYVRYSPLALDEVQDPYKPYPYERGYTRTEGTEVIDAPDVTTAKANPGVQLVVLTDEVTYSSATMLGVWVRDGKLGTIIGRASANAPNSYGDILYYQLSNTGTFGTVSHKQWQRPDAEAEGDELTPDVVTAVGEDALETALAYLTRE